MTLSRTLAILGRWDDRLVDRAVSASLPTADAATQQAVVDMLLERGDATGLAGVIRHFHGLAEAAQRRVIASAEALGAACQVVADEPDRDARLNMVEIIEAGSMPRLAYLIAAQLRADDGALTRAAAEGLFRLTRRYLMPAAPTGSTGSSDAAGGSDEAVIESLRSAVAEACATFERHRRRDVLLAVVCFTPRFGPRIERHAIDRDGVASAALAGLIRQGDHPLVRRRLLAAACVESLGNAVTMALREGEAGEDIDGLLSSGHLLAVPRVRRAVRAAGVGARLMPDAASADALSDRTLRWLWLWADATGASAEELARLAGALATDGRRAVRLEVLRWICRQDAEPLDEVTATLCFDPDPSVARLALRRLIARRWSGLNRLMLRLVTSEHEGVRRLAESRIAPIGFDRLWTNWGQLSAEDQVGAARALLRIDGSFGRKLWQKLRSGAAEDRLRAVTMVKQLGQAGYYQSDLRRLSRDGDPRVAEAAGAVLDKAQHETASDTAAASSLDPGEDPAGDAALETVERLDRATADAPQLIRTAGGAGDRSRARSVKALLAMPFREAMPRLRAMLQDDDQQLRSTALWVVERMGIGSIVPEVAQVARGDASPRVRRRAMRVLRAVANQPRQSGGTPTGTGGSTEQPGADEAEAMVSAVEAGREGGGL